MSYDIQGGGDLQITRDIAIMQNASKSGPISNLADLPAGFYVQGGSGSVLLSRIKIKRPDGTWASILYATEVHIQLPDGTWQTFT